MCLPDNEIKQLIISAGKITEATFNDVAVYAKESSLPLTRALLEKDVIQDILVLPP